MYTLSMEEVTIIVGGKQAILPKEVAEALGSNPSAVLAAFGEAVHSGQSKLAVRFYDNTLQLARADEIQWVGQYQRYTISSDRILGWSIFDHATGRCYNEKDLGNLPEFVQGKVPAQPGDSPEVLELGLELGKLAWPFGNAAEDGVAYIDMDELDAALAARH